MLVARSSGYFYPSDEQIQAHSRGCKICNLPEKQRNRVVDLMLDENSDQTVVKIANEELGLDLKLENVFRHRKYLPFLLTPDQVKKIVQNAKQNALADIPAVRIMDMEARVAETRLEVDRKSTRLNS